MSQMLRVHGWVGVCLMCVAPLLSGCKGEPRGGPRVDTFGVKGKILVDGKPASYLKVECHPDTPDPGVPMMPAAMTGADGSFNIATYEGGDGVPMGTYKLVFVWGEFNLMNGQYSGDKFKGKYSDPKVSEFRLSVAGAPVDLGEIELATK